jgi:hypothetical protein
MFFKREGKFYVFEILICCCAVLVKGQQIDVQVNIADVNENVNLTQIKAALPLNMSDIISYDDSNVSSAQALCPRGQYCPADSKLSIACGTGTYQNFTGKTVSSDCLPCAPGFYCPSLALDYQIECPIGYRCPSGSLSAAEICPIGTYQDFKNQASCKVCPIGHKCNMTGMTSPMQCGTGKYQPYTSQSICILCIPGQICTSNTNQYPANCTLGSWADPSLGGDQAEDCVSCPQGHYCPAGTTVPINCIPGTFMTGFGGASPLDCSSCTTGHFCIEASVKPADCPAGTYMPSTRANSSASCIPCPKGQYCIAGTTTPVNCLAGEYRDSTGGELAGDCSDCPVGQYCIAGTIIPTNCPAGTYNSDQRGTSSAACVPCPGGTYCGERTSSPISCPVGTFRAQGSSTVCVPCPEGKYCGEQTSSPVSCPVGTFRANTGAGYLSDCSVCTQGTFDVTTTARTTDCLTCPAISYCPSPLSKLTCPVNTISIQGSTSQLACRCNAGYFCTYIKKVLIVVTLNSTVDAFNNDVGGVRTQLIAAIAIAAGVTIDKITIGSVQVHTSTGTRRLLGYSDDGIDVITHVEGVDDDDVHSEVRHHFQKASLIQYEKWHDAHTVHTRMADNKFKNKPI